MKTLADFLALWTASNRPQYFDHRQFEAAGFKTHSAGHLVIAPSGLPQDVLAALPNDKPVLIGTSWTERGPVVAIGYPGIYAAGQAVFTVAHLNPEGTVRELFHSGVPREQSRAAA